ncbi:MAG: DNA recombination protein RmuC [Acutalibacteraceae bacterium]|nr:DNA recombination protein RmuC [Oscillospiraceae bacterium]
MEPLLITALIISAFCAVMLVILLVRKPKSNVPDDFFQRSERNQAAVSEQIKSLSSFVNDQFSRNRMEEAHREQQLRAEVKDSLNGMNELLKKMTQDNYEQRIQMSKALSSSLEDIRKSNEIQNEKQNALVKASITELQKSNEEKLEQMRQTVDEKLNTTLTARLNSSFKAVSEQLENVYKSLGEMKELSTGVTDNVSSLNRILTNVKARGTWAEIQLEAILDQTIPGMYDKNVVTDPKPNSREMVEFAVKIPSNDNKDDFTYLPIDSKFPMEDYARLCDAADRGDKAAIDEAHKALERRVLGCAKEITKYIHEPRTTPFAIMYLATEGLYSEIISSPSGIAEKIHSEFNVMISGPSTITALLNSLAMGFRAIAINEKAKEVRVLLAAAKKQYDTFGDLLAKAKKKIDEAGQTLDAAQSRNEMIQKKLRTVEEIDSGSATEILGLNE